MSDNWVEDSLYDDDLSFEDDDFDDILDVGCPVCGDDDLIIEGRCLTCSNCGWSKCNL